MFQSLCRFIRTPTKDAVDKMSVYDRAWYDMNAHIQDQLYPDMDYESHQMHLHVLQCIDRMIWFEQRLAGLNYFVFYRVVDSKYILYQFNTLMLEAAGMCTGDRLIVTPSINDCDYPDSMEQLMGWFKSKQATHDTGERCLTSMVAVNCTLFPNGNDRSFYRDGYSPVEARPVLFFDGYDGTPSQWENAIKEELTTRLSEPESSGLILQMEALYQEHSNELGNCLQICVPSLVLNQFVYPCVYYGTPISIRGNPHAYNAYNRFPSHPENEVPYEEFLMSSQACNTQARIIAHPNLYLKHGAVVNIMHGNPDFDPLGFRDSLREIIAPFLACPSVSNALAKFA